MERNFIFEKELVHDAIAVMCISLDVAYEGMSRCWNDTSCEIQCIGLWQLEDSFICSAAGINIIVRERHFNVRYVGSRRRKDKTTDFALASSKIGEVMIYIFLSNFDR